jgi:hypothetical protein
MECFQYYIYIKTWLLFITFCELVWTISNNLLQLFKVLNQKRNNVKLLFKPKLTWTFISNGSFKVLNLQQ